MAPGVKKTFKKELKKNLKYILEDKEINANELIDKTFNEIPIEDFCVRRYDTEILSGTALEIYSRLESNQEIEEAIKKAYNRAYDQTDRATYQAMEGFVHNLNTLNSRAGSQVPFSSINYGTDTSPEGRMVIRNLLLATEAGLGNGETPIFPIQIFKLKEGVSYNEEDPNADLFDLACRVSAKRLFPNFSFLDSPFNLQYYEEGKPETEATYMGCRTRVIGNVCGEETVTSRGNLSFTTINLPRLAILSNRAYPNEENKRIEYFFEKLETMLDLVKDQLLERMAFQATAKVKNFPFLMGEGIWRGSENLNREDYVEEVIKQGTLSIGFIGLAETLIELIGEHHGQSDKAQELGLKIVKHIRDFTDEKSKEYGLNFTTLATPEIAGNIVVTLCKKTLLNGQA